ncbi:hypothetical protein GEO60473_27760 [Geobacter sp. 60473]|nr:hypothetical protein GEO60473_27760 [Geobacter sp. 60473]
MRHRLSGRASCAFYAYWRDVIRNDVAGKGAGLAARGKDGGEAVGELAGEGAGKPVALPLDR